MFDRRKVFLYKVEATKFTDSTPTPSADLILPNGAVNVSVPTDQDMGEGDLKGTYGPGDSATVKQTMSIAIATRVRGLGQGVSALLVPHEHPALMSSGHTVVSAGDGSAIARSALYTPSSVPANLKSGSGYYYEDGLLYKLLGAVNGLSFEASMKALLMKFTPQTKYVAPTAVAVPAWSAPTQKLFRMTSALCVVTEAATPVNIGSFSFDTGSKVEEANETGILEYNLTDRNPTISIDPRAAAVTTDWAALTNCTSMALVATFTNELGETLVFTAPKAVPMEVSRGSRSGIITRPMKYSLKETAGDDQYTIKWTGIL